MKAEEIAALSGMHRPAWYHPWRRWLWDHGVLAADGRSSLLFIKPLERKKTKADRERDEQDLREFVAKYTDRTD